MTTYCNVMPLTPPAPGFLTTQYEVTSSVDPEVLYNEFTKHFPEFITELAKLDNLSDSESTETSQALLFRLLQTKVSCFHRKINLSNPCESYPVLLLLAHYLLLHFNPELASHFTTGGEGATLSAHVGDVSISKSQPAVHSYLSKSALLSKVYLAATKYGVEYLAFKERSSGPVCINSDLSEAYLANSSFCYGITT